MTPDRWDLVKKVLETAWERGEDSRAAYLEEACSGDPELRSRVDALLASDKNSDELMWTFAPEGVSQQGQLRSAIAESSETLTEVPDGSVWIGKRIGPYTITALIGSGGMGTVYRAIRVDDFRMDVAIKLLNRGADTKAALSRFRTERQILAGLHHPNIARLLDGGATDDGVPYFAMEYVDGRPLLEYAASLPVRGRLELFRSVCSAVQYAHRNSIVHRDIKPANILVTGDGVPKLLDFGIAKLLEPTPAADAAVATVTGVRPMTPAYASPEQLRAEPLTEATDIYSLGLVLYELLTGTRARQIEGLSAAGMERAIGSQPKPPSAIDANVDPDLDSIVLMALRPEISRRYGSVAEFSDDIGRFLQELPVHATPESPAYRLRKFLDRNRMPVLAAAITGLMVLGFAALVGRFLPSSRPAGASPKSIAVLPLENRSADQQQEYFAEGVTDSLIAQLAQIPGLRVISRTSTTSYKGARRLPEIARTLDVQSILEGSVLRAGNRVRIDVRLVDAPKDQPIWNATYEGELDHLLDLQEQLATAIAGEIRVTLTESDRARVFRRRRVDLAAYDAYLKGRHEYFASFTKEATQRAIAHFQHSLALDPAYAPAYAGLANCYFLLSNVYSPPTEVMPKARSAASKALELDDRLGQAYAILALVQSVYEFNRAEATKSFQRAIELEPGNAEAHLWYSQHLAGLGRFDEALAEVSQAQKLDPVSTSVNTYRGLILFLARRYDELIQRMQLMVDLHPEYHQAYVWRALAYEQKREWDRAITDMAHAYELDGEAEALAQLGHIYAVAGRKADARKVLGKLQQISRQRYLSAYNFAVLAAGLGDRDEAFRWLQMVEQDRSEWFAAAGVDPRLDELHADPRFAGVLQSVGLGR